MVNHNNLEIGQVVYFVTRTGYNYRYVIDFGIVDDIWHDKIAVKRLVNKERRLINGVPYNDFKTPTRWQKLPKGWTYNTQLFTLDYEEIPERAKNYKINNSDDILKAIEDGFLIYTENKDFSNIEVEIDNKLGWRLIRKYDSNNDKYFRSTFDYNEVFYSYDDAKKWIDDYEAELTRQSSLSDEEWSLEQIEHNVSRYVWYTYADEEVRNERKNNIINWFKEQKNVDDIETRLYGSTIQWKYWKNKKWNEIPEKLL